MLCKPVDVNCNPKQQFKLFHNNKRILRMSLNMNIFCASEDKNSKHYWPWGVFKFVQWLLKSQILNQTGIFFIKKKSFSTLSMNASQGSWEIVLRKYLHYILPYHSQRPHYWMKFNYWDTCQKHAQISLENFLLYKLWPSLASSLSCSRYVQYHNRKEGKKIE